MRVHAFATTTALACVLLAGCSDDPVGPVDDTSASTTSASPTPTGPTPPPLPDAAQADTTAGAVAFVKHYIELLNYAANTGDVVPLESNSQDCQGCEAYIENYRSTYESGGYFKDPGWDPIAPAANDEGEVVVVVTEVDAPAVTYVSKPGAEPVVGSDETYSLRFEVSERSGQWVITSFAGE